MMSEPWEHEAACIGKPPEIFFSVVYSDIKEAKAVCAECPVRLTCLTKSLERQDRFGVFGGVDHYERRRALQINNEGHATALVKPIRCPICRSENLVVNKKRRSWMSVTCAPCSLTWVAKRVVPRKPTPEQETSPSEVVEPTIPADS